MNPIGMRVLIVEDETIIAMTAEDMIADIGCVVAATAASLEEATAAVAAGGFDVAMLDINLNGKQSFPAGMMLLDRRIPFIFTTGYGSAGPTAEFSAVEVVKKPYRAADLASAFQRALAA